MTGKEFLMYYENYEYSKEYFEFYKEAIELDLRFKWIENQQFLEDNYDTISMLESSESLFMEDASADKKEDTKKKAEEDSDFFLIKWIKEIWKAIGKFFSWIGKAMSGGDGNEKLHKTAEVVTAVEKNADVDKKTVVQQTAEAVNKVMETSVNGTIVGVVQIDRNSDAAKQIPNPNEPGSSWVLDLCNIATLRDTSKDVMLVVDRSKLSNAATGATFILPDEILNALKKINDIREVDRDSLVRAVNDMRRELDNISKNQYVRVLYAPNADSDQSAIINEMREKYKECHEFMAKFNTFYDNITKQEAANTQQSSTPPSQPNNPPPGNGSQQQGQQAPSQANRKKINIRRPNNPGQKLSATRVQQQPQSWHQNVLNFGKRLFKTIVNSSHAFNIAHKLTGKALNSINRYAIDKFVGRVNKNLANQLKTDFNISDMSNQQQQSPSQPTQQVTTESVLVHNNEPRYLAERMKDTILDFVEEDTAFADEFDESLLEYTYTPIEISRIGDIMRNMTTNGSSRSRAVALNTFLENVILYDDL